MSTEGRLEEIASTPAALPPINDKFGISTDYLPVVSSPHSDGPQSIAGFVCIIAYKDAVERVSERLIDCRRYDRVGEIEYVGAVSASGYGQFRCDRIESVSDAETGEVLGNGSFFSQFQTDAIQPKKETWNLTSSRKAHLIAGLNILAFMARCDGHWHPLEEDAIESFVCSLWLRKEWESEPPLREIVRHAQRLAPDGSVFFHSLEQYARSQTSSKLIKRAVTSLIEADGVVCAAEYRWAAEMVLHLETLSE